LEKGPLFNIGDFAIIFSAKSNTDRVKISGHFVELSDLVKFNVISIFHLSGGGSVDADVGDRDEISLDDFE